MNNDKLFLDYFLSECCAQIKISSDKRQANTIQKQFRIWLIYVNKRFPLFPHITEVLKIVKQTYYEIEKADAAKNIQQWQSVAAITVTIEQSLMVKSKKNKKRLFFF